MSEKEKVILDSLGESLSKATDEQKQYILGLADGMAFASETRKKSEAEKE